jgi:tRNA threonylcarbamoyladenosine biosynthesis protein TsaE
MQIEILSRSPGHTLKIGRMLSEAITGGDILLFCGELGGGKTTFISGLARGLKVTDDISSPSFVILNEYKAGKLKLVHIDFYRLDGIDEFENIGIDEYIYDSSNIVCIEWGEKVRDFIDRDHLILDFKYQIDGDGINKRKIVFSSSSPYWDDKLKKFKRIMEKEQGTF